MMNKFTRTVNGVKDASLKDVFMASSEGQCVVSWKVAGFWSEPVTVIIERDIFTEEWGFKISHSSGGHEDGFDEVKRTKNFASALVDAANVVDFLKTHVDELEEDFCLQEKQRINDELNHLITEATDGMCCLSHTL